ncbi:MAG: hypothetical protein U0169_10935 [Polyangiaceae bacterium]
MPAGFGDLDRKLGLLWLTSREATFPADAAVPLGERPPMVAFLRALSGASIAALSPRASLVVENLALRQQLAVLRRVAPRQRSGPVDPAFRVVLSRAWSRWADTLVVVNPVTLVG